MNAQLDPAGTGGEPPIRRLRTRERALVETVFLGPNGVRAGWRAALYVALFVVIFTALQFLLALAFPRSSLLESILTPQVLLFQELLLVAGAFGSAQIMALLEGRSIGAYGVPWRGAFGARFWQGTLWGILQLSAIMLPIDFWGGYTFGGLALHGRDIVWDALLWGLTFLAVGFAEEFLFRGYLQFTLTEGIGFWPAAALLSVSFGAVHLRNPGEGPVGALSVVAIGIFLCFTLWRTGDLWWAIGWHAAFDFGETYLYSVPNSGIVTRGHLLAASLHGPRWISGGAVGPEGSLAAFAVLAVAFAAFDRLYRPRRENAHALNGRRDDSSVPL